MPIKEENSNPCSPILFQPEDIDPTDFYYSRISAPSTSRFEAVLSSLLNASAISYSSGQSALLSALVMLNPRRIAITDAYFGSHGLIAIIERMSGVKTLPLDCPAEDLQSGDLIYLETPLSPGGRASNIEEYAKKAHSQGAYLLVNSSLAPPGLQDPFAWGADLVMHAGSKYLGGHSDMLCGVLATKNQTWLLNLRKDRQLLGNVMGNFESWLGLRSIRTLQLRVQRQSNTATQLVRWIDGILKDPNSDQQGTLVNAAVRKIDHSSLQTNDFTWLEKQMPNGFGPVFAIWMQNEELARSLPSKLKFFSHATSMGGVDSTVEWRRMSDPITDRRILRFSIGLEEWQDLRDDLLEAFRLVVYPTVV